MNEREAMDLLTRADPVSDEGEVVVRRSAAELIAEYRRRAGDPTAPDVAKDDGPELPATGSWIVLAVAASLVALLVASIALVLTVRSGESPLDPAPAANSPATTAPPATTASVSSTSSTSSASVVAIVDRLVDAVNEGDLADVMSQFDRDVRATLTSGLGEPDTDADPQYGRDDVERVFAGLLAEGTDWSGAECSPTQPIAGDPAVRCTLLGLPMVLEVVGDEPQPTTVLVAAGDQITRFHVSTDDRRAALARASFLTWLDRVDPDGSPPAAANPEEAAALGAYRAAHMEEWAAYLRANDCEYTSPCTIELERWVAEYDDECLAPVETADRPTDALYHRMSKLPPPDGAVDRARRLLQIDATLLDLDGQRPEGDAIVPLRQERADLMTSIGIDEGCRPLPAN